MPALDRLPDLLNAEDLAGEDAVVRYGTPDELYVDFVAKLGDAFSFTEHVSWAGACGEGRPVSREIKAQREREPRIILARRQTGGV